MARSNMVSRLVGEMEARIDSMRVGEALPPEQALADAFGVCKLTLRRALSELAANGLIVKKNGVGSIVAGKMRVIPRELVFLCRDLAFFREAVNRFSLRAIAGNYLCSIVPLCGDRAARERIAASVVTRNPSGIALYADPSGENEGVYRALEASGIPLLHLVRLPENTEGNLLSFEAGGGVAAVVRRFYDEGCRRFALYGDAAVNPAAAAERRRGFFEGMRRVRLLPRKEHICTAPEELNAFVDLFHDSIRRPDAVVCLNDVCAGNLYRKLLRAGADPKGVRFSGFDASPVTAFLPFPLLTVRPPLEELGEAAAEMLIRRIENPGFGFTTRKLTSQLVEIDNR